MSFKHKIISNHLKRGRLQKKLYKQEAQSVCSCYVDGNIEEIKTVNDDALIANITEKEFTLIVYLVQGLH